MASPLWETKKQFVPVDERPSDQRPRAKRAKGVSRWIYVAAAAAIGVGWLMLRRPPHDGPWCVWARPLGTIGAAAGTGGSWGDVRIGAAGDVARATWTSAGRVSGGRPWMPILRRAENPILAWVALERERTFVPTEFVHSLGGDVWTAFVAEVRPGDLARRAPDRHTSGMWKVTDPSGADRWFILELDGSVRDAGAGATWAVGDGALVIDVPDASAPGGATIVVGVLAPDGWSFVGRDHMGRTMKGQHSGH